MKTRTIKIDIPCMLLILIIFIPDSAVARRFLFNPPLDFEWKWERTNVSHSYPQGFNYVQQIGWVFNTAWKRGRSQSRPWVPHPTAISGADVLQSDDKQCELYYPMAPDDARSWARDPQSYLQNPFVFYTEPRLAHRNFIKLYLSEFKGQADFRFEDYVTVIGGNMPREYFNADSVFFWDFPIEPTEQEGEIYTECIFMYIWNKERWLGLTFAWFFTDKGKEQKWSYIDKLKGHVWYKDKPRDPSETSTTPAPQIPPDTLKHINKRRSHENTHD